MQADAVWQRLDSFPYVHRVADVMVQPVVTAQAAATLEQTVARLHGERIGSCIVVDDDGRAIGIVTERDVLNGVATQGPAALQQPLRAIMSTPVESIAPDVLLYRAMARMDRRGIRHLAVLDSKRRPIGMVTARSLLRLRAGRSLAIGDAVESAADVETLRQVHDQLPELARALLAEQIVARDVSEVLSAITRDITTRAAQLATQEMATAGEGAAPAPWSLLLLGSAGRGESLLAPDQDNALVVDDGGAAHVDGWYLHFAERLNALLDRAGIPLCKGGVMAKNRPWRRTVQEWEAQIDRWMARPEGEALLNVDIFFDAVAVAGDTSLAARVLRYAHHRAAGEPAFLRLLAEAGTAHRPPLGLLGRLRLDKDGRVDLKRGGLLPIVSAARVMALKLGIDAVSTSQRLQRSAATGRIGADNSRAMELARDEIAGAVLSQQLADLAANLPPGNRVDARRLARADKHRLVAALRQAGEASALVSDVLTS